MRPDSANVAASNSPLAALVEARRDEIVQRFVERAHDAGASEALPRADVTDLLEEYLDELAARLREEADDVGAAERETVAASHGKHRFFRGYDLPALVREYGALRELLWDIILEHGSVPLEETRRLFTYLLEGVGIAAGAYANLRDAELRRQAISHVAFLAHEVRNPLGSAMMALSLLGSDPTVRSTRAFKALERGLTKASQLVDDALVTVRLRELGRLDCSEVDVGRLAQRIVDESDQEAAAKNLVVRVEGEGTIRADIKSLGSALSNLVRNAIKFSHPGGEVQIRVRHAGPRLMVEVEDACGGLPPGAERKVFDPYVQAGADKSGFGLGLAIAKQAAEAHGGQLRVHDLPGKGCVFVLDLPPNPPCDDTPNATAA